MLDYDIQAHFTISHNNDRIYVVVQIVFMLDDKCELYPNDALLCYNNGLYICSFYAKTLSQFVVASIHFV